MKRIFYNLFVIVGLVVLTTSCGKNNCCNCDAATGGFSGEVCEKDFTSNGGTTQDWEDWKAAVSQTNPATGQPFCNCD